MEEINKENLSSNDGMNSYSSQSTLELNNSLESNPFVDTVSMDNLSIDINGSLDINESCESTLDFQEITQGILDLEDTQTCFNRSNYEISSDNNGKTDIPSSPPPSYELVLAESQLTNDNMKTNSQASNSSTLDIPVATPVVTKKGVEIMHKSHKEFYRAVAKQWGITCKMSDHCRCLDCQSMYFDCEYDQNEQEKTDGGLGAGTPMFISEVMHGSACSLV